MCFDHLLVNNADDADADDDDGENTFQILLSLILSFSYLSLATGLFFFLKRIENLDEIWASHLLISKQVYFCLYLQ